MWFRDFCCWTLRWVESLFWGSVGTRQPSLTFLFHWIQQPSSGRRLLWSIPVLWCPHGLMWTFMYICKQLWSCGQLPNQTWSCSYKTVSCCCHFGQSEQQINSKPNHGNQLTCVPEQLSQTATTEVNGCLQGVFDQVGLDWSKLVKTGTSWSRAVRAGPSWSKLV